MKVIAAQPAGRFQVALRFDNGAVGTVDLREFAGRGVFKSWLDAGVFEQVSISEAGALEWPGELDLCPDALYLRLVRKSASDVFPASQISAAHA